VVVSWTAEDGSFVHRVVTRQIDVATSRATALRGVDCHLSALLLAKRVIQDARDRDAASSPKEAEKLQQSIGESLFSFLIVQDQLVPIGPMKLEFCNMMLLRLPIVILSSISIKHNNNNNDNNNIYLDDPEYKFWNSAI
jgi:hypothetical protein